MARPQEKVVNMSVAPGESPQPSRRSGHALTFSFRWLEGGGQNSGRHSGCHAQPGRHCRLGSSRCRDAHLPTWSRASSCRQYICKRCRDSQDRVVCRSCQDCPDRLAPRVHVRWQANHVRGHGLWGCAPLAGRQGASGGHSYRYGPRSRGIGRQYGLFRRDGVVQVQEGARPGACW